MKKTLAIVTAIVAVAFPANAANSWPETENVVKLPETKFPEKFPVVKFPACSWPSWPKA